MFAQQCLWSRDSFPKRRSPSREGLLRIRSQILIYRYRYRRQFDGRYFGSMSVKPASEGGTVSTAPVGLTL